MALNPPLQDNMPLGVSGEFYLLQRDGIHVEIRVDGFSKLKGKGSIFLTTLRMVFVASPPVQADGVLFRSFDLPLKLLRHEKFNQPIFGCNNLSGTVNPIPGMGLPSEASFKLSFRHGGVGTFLPLFIRALKEMRFPDCASVAPGSTSLLNAVQSGVLQSQAFVDPNDPSTIYVTQPTVVAEALPPTVAYPGAPGSVPVAEAVPVATAYPGS